MTPTVRKHVRRYQPTQSGRAILTPPVLFIGDLHGNVQFLDHVQQQFPDHKKVFVGDFVDSRDGSSRNDEIVCLERVLAMIEYGEARACFGNHEWSYLEPALRCSGYDPAFEKKLASYRDRMRNLLEFFIWLPDQRILVTHAGLSLNLWNECNLSFETFEGKLLEWSMLPVSETPAGWIGMARGGIDPTGGIFWCDWYSEFQPVEGITQIFGHTSGRSATEENGDAMIGIRTKGSAYNIDCLSRKWEILELDDAGRLRTITVRGSTPG